jgi:hypothetical protein
MRFNPSSFLSGGAVNLATRAIRIGLNASGMSLGGINNIAYERDDYLSSGSGREYYGFAGRAIERINPQDLELFRGSYQLTTGTDPESVISENKEKNAGTDLSYPPDMGEYFIKLKFAEYHRPTPLSQSKFETKASVCLPIPRNLIESHKVGYKEIELGLVGGIADMASESINMIRGRTEPASYSDIGMRALETGAGALYAAGVQKATSLLGEDGTATTAALGQVIGSVPNPHAAMIFNGPILRTHSFSWIFSPNNAEESKKVKEICNLIRQKTLPAKSLSSASNILDYPWMVEPELFPKTDGESLYKFKRSVITNIEINNTPTGIPSFFAGTKLPTLIKLSLTIAEIEYFLSEDFGGKSGRVEEQIVNTTKSIADAIRGPERALPGVGKGKNVIDNFRDNSGGLLEGGV